MMCLPYDPDDPPADPPEGADRLVWTLATRVWLDHRADAVGFCVAESCRTRHAPAPCEFAELADNALVEAVSRQQPPGYLLLTEPN